MRLIHVALVALGVAMSYYRDVVAQSLTSEFGNGGVITVQSLKRSGSESVILKGVIENTGSSDLKIDELLVGQYGGGRAFSANLQDPIAKKQYQQVKVDDTPLGSKHTSYLKTKEKITVWARITAPPLEVEKVTVVFGGSAVPVEDVPLQK